MDRTCLRAILRITSAKGLDRIPTSLHIKFVNNWILGLWLNSEEIKCGWSKFCNCLKLLQRCLLSTQSLSFLSHFLYKHFLGVYKAKASTDESLLTPVLNKKREFFPHNAVGNVSGESGISFRNRFYNKGHQMIIIFYESVKSAAVTAMWYTVQRALLTLANHIQAWSKDEGLVAKNLALKEF